MPVMTCARAIVCGLGRRAGACESSNGRLWRERPGGLGRSHGVCQQITCQKEEEQEDKPEVSGHPPRAGCRPPRHKSKREYPRVSSSVKQALRHPFARFFLTVLGAIGMLKPVKNLEGGAMMKKLVSALVLAAAPVMLTLGYAVLPSICLVLFFIFPPLVLLCIGPFAGLLPTDFQTFL